MDAAKTAWQPVTAHDSDRILAASATNDPDLIATGIAAGTGKPLPGTQGLVDTCNERQ